MRIKNHSFTYIVTLAILFLQLQKVYGQIDSARYLQLSVNFPALTVHELYLRFVKMDSLKKYKGPLPSTDMEYDSLKNYMSEYIDKDISKMTVEDFDYFIVCMRNGHCDELTLESDSNFIKGLSSFYFEFMVVEKKQLPSMELTYNGHRSRAHKQVRDMPALKGKGGAAEMLLLLIYIPYAIIVGGSD